LSCSFLSLRQVAVRGEGMGQSFHVLGITVALRLIGPARVFQRRGWIRMLVRRRQQKLGVLLQKVYGRILPIDRGPQKLECRGGCVSRLRMASGGPEHRSHLARHLSQIDARLLIVRIESSSSLTEFDGLAIRVESRPGLSDTVKNEANISEGCNNVVIPGRI